MTQRRSLNPLRRRPKAAHRFSDRIAAHQVTHAHTHPVEARHMHTQLDQWQEKILTYAGIVPEVMTGYSFVHNVLDRVSFEIERFDRASNEWKADESPEIQGIERRFNHGFRAGRAAALLHLIEEVFVLVTRTTSHALRFETLAATELRYKNRHNEKRILIDGSKEAWEVIPDDVTIIRVYTPDPADRHLAGGPHKSLTGLLEVMALELLSDHRDATSVLAGNGVFVIPEEILPELSEDLEASEAPGSRSHFERRLEEAMTAPISDPHSPDGVVPITLFAAAEHIEKIRHVTLTRESATESTKRMDSYITRYARDIDLPAQIILGLGDTNHWTDWKVDENTWAYHLEPRAQRIADALYAGLVARIIANIGLDPDEYRLVPNPSKAVAQQDQSGTAIDVYKTGALKPEALIEATGFDAGDMRVDAEETLLAWFDQQAKSQNAGAPDRTAAASAPVRRPATILRGASKIANQQQRQLDALYRSVLGKVAGDAAKAGAAAKRKRDKADKTAASDPVVFEGYDAGSYFAKYRDILQAGTIDQLFTMLRRIATLTNIDYPALRSLWSVEFASRAQAVAKTAEQAALKIERASYKSGKPARVTEATIRTMTSTANGGSTESNGAAGNTKRPTHAAADPALQSTLRDEVGAFATQYTWIHDEPARPYPPHEALHGRSWFSWQEFDALDHSGDTFPQGNVYFPGDHDGCLCEYEIDFVELDQATQEKQ